MLCCGYTLTDFPISIRLTSLALWQSNDCPSASKATLMNMDKYFMWIHYERLHNHNKAKHNKTVCIFLGIYCSWFPLQILFPQCVQWWFMTTAINISKGIRSQVFHSKFRSRISRIVAGIRQLYHMKSWDLAISSSKMCFSVIFIHIVMISKYLYTYSHLCKSPVTA